MKLLYDKVWFYVNSRVDEGVLPDEDEIYTMFQDYFEIMGYNPDVIGEAVKSVVSCTDMNGVEINWEGELDGISA